MTQDASEMYAVRRAYGNKEQRLPGFRGKIFALELSRERS